MSLQTGTTSLGNAFEQLGMRNTHMDRTLVPFLFAPETYDFSGLPDWLDASAINLYLLVPLP